MHKKPVIAYATALFLVPAVAWAEDVWRPDPRFSIEGSSYIETLTFISGFAYAITYSGKKLSDKSMANFYCAPGDAVIDSKLLIDIVNNKLQGDHSSEVVTKVILEELPKRYPCEK